MKDTSSILNLTKRIWKTNEGVPAINLSIFLCSRSSIHAEGPLKITLPNVHGRAQQTKRESKEVVGH